MIRKFVFLIAALMLLCPMVFGQYAYRIRPLPALPATCNPANGDVVMLTAGAGISPGVYNCTILNTWRPVGWIANGLVWTQGVLTASTPVVTHTATWNNAGVQFFNIRSNVTNTASLASSQLLTLQVGGGDRFTVDIAGNAFAAASMQTGASGLFWWLGRSAIMSPADSVIEFVRQDGTTFTRLNFGPNNATHLGLTFAGTVGGFNQGLIINNADGTDPVFANLGAAPNGSIIYCSDCTIANPCAGAGSGAIAKRLNGVWVCN